MENGQRGLVSFRQAEGLDPLPSQLALRSVSQEMRSLLWEALYQSLQAWNHMGNLHGAWEQVARDWHVRHQHLPADEFNKSFVAQSVLVKNIVWSADYGDLFEFITFLVRHDRCPPNIAEKIAEALIESRAAYRLIGSTIYPVATPDEVAALVHAQTALADAKYAGAQSHFQTAGDLLTTGDFAGSVRESIHAVEATAKSIDPKASTLSEALKRLDAGGRINPNLKRALNALYDYSSDEKGVRHAKVFAGSPNVDEVDALFMIGACAAFISYLVAQARAVVATP